MAKRPFGAVEELGVIGIARINESHNGFGAARRPASARIKVSVRSISSLSRIRLSTPSGAASRCGDGPRWRRLV